MRRLRAGPCASLFRPAIGFRVGGAGDLFLAFGAVSPAHFRPWASSFTPFLRFGRRNRRQPAQPDPLHRVVGQAGPDQFQACLDEPPHPELSQSQFVLDSGVAKLRRIGLLLNSNRDDSSLPCARYCRYGSSRFRFCRKDSNRHPAGHSNRSPLSRMRPDFGPIVHHLLQAHQSFVLQQPLQPREQLIQGFLTIGPDQLVDADRGH